MWVVLFSVLELLGTFSFTNILLAAYVPCLNQLSLHSSCSLCHIPSSLYCVESFFLGLMLFIHSSVFRLAVFHVVDCILHIPRRSCPVGHGSQTLSMISQEEVK